MNQPLTFYFAPKTVSLASHLALEDAGAIYQPHQIDFARVEQRSSSYLDVNPKGRVPALETHRGIISETPAILMYIAQTFPQAKLAPLNDPYLFAKCQEFNLYLCSTVHVAHAHRVRGSRWADDDAAIEAMQRKVKQNMQECFALIETKLFAGPWVLGEAYSICDAYLFTIVQWLVGDEVDVKQFQKIRDFDIRMRERPSVIGLADTYSIPAVA
ncbi:MAG: glutathione S-transferase [Pseudohongiellaceae bacterium]|jgi:glutathione S-transferase